MYGGFVVLVQSIFGGSSMILLIRLLFAVIGVIIGGFAYKFYANKYLIETMAGLLSDIIEENGVVPFIDTTYNLHCLPKDKFCELLEGMLRDLEPPIEV